MATCKNRKRGAVPIANVGRVIKVIHRPDNEPNVALVETDKDERLWVLLNVNVKSGQ